jgi:hypothetical protein
MAREIHIPYGVVGSADVYLRFRDASGKYRRGDTGAYESWNAANIALYGADTGSGVPYHVAAEDGSTGDYFADLPDATARTWSAYVQAGATPSADGGVDVEIAADEIVQGAAAAAIAAANLDHIAGTATDIPALPAGTWLDTLRSDGTATYDRTTDSLQAIRDTAPLGTAMRGTDGAYTGTPPTADAIGTDAASKILATPTNKLATDNAGAVTPTAASKTGYSLAATGLDAITATEPTGKPTTFPGWLMWLVQRFRRSTKSATQIVVKTEAGATVTTQTITSSGDNQTLGAPS